jgi:hypothetical protein
MKSLFFLIATMILTTSCVSLLPLSPNLTELNYPKKRESIDLQYVVAPFSDDGKIRAYSSEENPGLYADYKINERVNLAKMVRDYLAEKVNLTDSDNRIVVSIKSLKLFAIPVSSDGEAALKSIVGGDLITQSKVLLVVEVSLTLNGTETKKTIRVENTQLHTYHMVSSLYGRMATSIAMATNVNVPIDIIHAANINEANNKVIHSLDLFLDENLHK